VRPPGHLSKKEEEKDRLQMLRRYENKLSVLERSSVRAVASARKEERRKAAVAVDSLNIHSSLLSFFQSFWVK
jgi:hypothetical protein